MAFSPRGQTLATATCWGTIRLWNTSTGKLLREVKAHDDGSMVSVSAVVYSPDGKLVASASHDKTVKVWELPTFTLRYCLKHRDIVSSLAFSPDGKCLVSGSAAGFGNGLVRVWDTTSWKETRQWKAQRDNVFTLAFLPDSKRLISGGPTDGDSDIGRRRKEDGPAVFLRLWEVESGKEIGQFNGHSESVSQIAISPDGKLLASGGRDETIRLWDIPTTRESRTLVQKAGEVHSLAFSPCGRVLASGFRDGSIRLWDVATGRIIRDLKGHQVKEMKYGNTVWSLAFSPDGMTLASGSSDERAFLWDITGVRVDRRLVDDHLPSRDLQRFWADLGSGNPDAAHHATWMLVANKDSSIAFLRSHLHQVGAAASSQRIATLIADLGNDSFSVREKASRELELLGESAQNALRQAIKKDASLEVRRRAETLLQRQAIWDSERLQKWRALAVLENARCPEATSLLRSLSEGIPEAWLTQEAKASLQRIEQRPKK